MATSDGNDTAMAELPASTSISAAAHQYQMAMSQQEAIQHSGSADAIDGVTGPTGDSLMNGEALGMIDVC
jgi:hypothetical protein